MCKLNKKNGGRRIDICMVNLVNFINKTTKLTGFRTVSSCCGHGKYPPSLLVKHTSYQPEDFALEIFSRKIVKRKKKFYKKDKQGYYYIPETLAVNKKEDDGLHTDESVGIRPTIL